MSVAIAKRKFFAFFKLNLDRYIHRHKIHLDRKIRKINKSLWKVEHSISEKKKII